MKIQVFSQSFSGGGAERVLSYLVNNDKSFQPISLTDQLHYLNDSANATVLNPRSKSRYKIIRQIKTIKSIYTIYDRRKTSLTCSIEIFFCLWFVKLLKLSKAKIIFRPSIDNNYFLDVLKSKTYFLYNFIEKLYKIFLRNSILIFQTSLIEKSFRDFEKNLNGSILRNPITKLNLFRPQKNYSMYEKVDCCFVGRCTKIKGIDRFINLSNHNDNRFSWHIYGDHNIEKIDQDTANVQFHGWQQKSNIIHQNPTIILPSILEGSPNIFFEAVASDWPIIVSREVSEILQDDNMLNGLYKYVDFAIDSPIDILNTIFEYNTQIFYQNIKKNKTQVDRLLSERGIKQYIKGIKNLLSKDINGN